MVNVLVEAFWASTWGHTMAPVVTRWSEILTWFLRWMRGLRMLVRLARWEIGARRSSPKKHVDFPSCTISQPMAREISSSYP
jgi:hypothetical protein